MKSFILIVSLVFSMSVFADKQDDIAEKYLEFLLFESESLINSKKVFVSKPEVWSFHSKSGKRMIVASGMLSKGESFWALFSVNELKMGFLAWKSRGYGKRVDEDIKYYMTFDGKEFDFEGW